MVGPPCRAAVLHGRRAVKPDSPSPLKRRWPVRLHRPPGSLFTATLSANAAGIPSVFAVIAATGCSDRAGQPVACATPDEVLKRFSIGLLKSRRPAAEREIRL